MRDSRIRAMVLILLGAFSFSAPGFAADFPNKPIRMIIAMAPGGGADVLARTFKPSFEAALGTQLIIENIPAGSTKVATMELMKAKPDGYTIILFGHAQWIVNYYAGIYDTKVWEIATPIANLTSEPYGFIEVRADSPYKIWGDLVKAAKEKPGQLTCGGPGAAGMLEVILRVINKSAGIETRYVPFAGAGPNLVALLGGHIDFRICIPAEAITMIRAGKTRGLAVSLDKRMEALPDVPTFKELGIGPTLKLYRQIWGPPNLPPKIVDVIGKAVEKASKDPKYVKIIQDELLYTVDYMPAQRLVEQAKNFNEVWGPFLEESYKK